MKKLIVLGAFLLAFSGLYSVCSAYTLTIKNGSLTSIDPATETAVSVNSIVKVYVRVYKLVGDIWQALDGINPVTGNTYQSVPYNRNIDEGSKVWFQVSVRLGRNSYEAVFPVTRLSDSSQGFIMSGNRTFTISGNNLSNTNLARININ